MTLFANSGVAWPRHEQETKEAGKKSLESASQIFQILANMESGTEFNQSSELDRTRCAEGLEQASMIYKRVAESLSGEAAMRLTGSEFELAGVNELWRGFWGDEFYSVRRPYTGQIPIDELYRDLSHRLIRLASAIRQIDLSVSAFDAAPQVFQILRQWELISTLSRLIATLGRRSTRVGG